MYRNYQNHCVFIQLNIGYIGIVVNLKTVEILKKKYHLGDIISFKVIELDQNKKRYVLDIYNNNTEYVKENNNTQELSTTSLNVCEKSFYPRSYLKLVEGNNNNNNNNINSNNNNSNTNNTNNSEYTKPTSLYDLLNSKDNNYVISVNVNSFSSTANNNNTNTNNNHNINYKKINNTNIEKSNYNKKK
jgi:hypothetical protein